MTITIPSKALVNQDTKLDFGTSVKMKEVLYVPGLKKNLLSISALDKKWYRVDFLDAQVLVWSKGNTLEDVVVIGKEEGGLYKIKGHPETTLVHDTTSSSELWNIRLAHINYKALPYVRRWWQVYHIWRSIMKVLAKDVQEERTLRIHFRRVKQRLKVHWNEFILMYVVLCPPHL